MTSIDVKKVRENLHLSQSQFSQTYGIRIGTLRKWEQHRATPTGPALILLAVLSHAPHIVSEALQAAVAGVVSK